MPKKKTTRTSGTGKAGRPALTKQQQELRERRALENLKRGQARCSFLTKAGQSCMGAVVETSPDGWSFCNGHRNRAKSGYLPEMKAEITDKGIDKVLNQAGIGASDGKTPKRAVDAIDQALGQHLSIKELEALAGTKLQKNSGIQTPTADGHVYKPGGLRWRHGQTAKFAGVDFSYYDDGYINDHIYLLDKAIYFAFAKLNMLYHQLQQIEEEEMMLKVTEHRGTQMVNGKEMEFENTLIRHSTPTEIRLKLFDTMTKAEQHYASLLKQKESLLVTALSIMRKLNIKFSREAGQMVVAAHEAKVIAEAHDSKPLPLETGYVIPAHILDKAQEEAKAFQALDSHIEDGVTVHRITKEDLKKAHELNEQAVAEQIYAERPEEKPLMIDDDW